VNLPVVVGLGRRGAAGAQGRCFENVTDVLASPRTTRQWSTQPADPSRLRPAAREPATCAGCVIGGVCLSVGAEANGNPCLVCDPNGSSTSFTAAVGRSCGADSNGCSQQDACDSEGRCQPNHLPAGAPCGSSVSSACDQADVCDGNGNCQQQLAQNGTACDDGAFCTTGDQCQAGQCVPTGNQNCGASRTCNETTNQCQCQGCAIGGGCLAPGTINPADPCQLCDPGRSANGFSAGMNGSACDDGAFCTVGDQCQSGQCASGGPRGCENGQRCDETANACVPVPVAVQLAAWLTAAAQATTPLPVTSVVQGVSGSDMTAAPAFPRGPDLGAIFSPIGWPSDGTLDLTKYVQFGIAPSGTARSIMYDHLEFSIAAGGGFPSASAIIPTSWQLRSDLDAFQFPLASGTVSISLNQTAVPVAPSIRSIGTVAESVTFRVYLFTSGGLATTGMGIVDLGVFGVVQ